MIPNLDLAKRFATSAKPIASPRNEPVEAVNPALADLYRETFGLSEPCPEYVTEQVAIQALDVELIP
jgi:hypothetical protein